MAKVVETVDLQVWCYWEVGKGCTLGRVPCVISVHLVILFFSFENKDQFVILISQCYRV